jgi:antitoxin component YwqK of YwqJK toxin-antitoxin module
MKYKYKVILLFLNINLLFVPVYGQENNDIISNGYNKLYFKNGKVSSEGNLISGKPEGYWKTYYENGQLKSEGDRLDFELYGNWKFYTPEGILKDEIMYLGGKKNGASKQYDKEGNIYIISYYKMDVKDSIETTFYPNGNVHTEIPFINGLEEGTGYEYDSIDGRLITIFKYKAGYLRSKQKINRTDNAGRKQGKWLVFYKDGILMTEGYYKDGKRNGVFKEYDKNGSLKEINKFDDDIPDLEAKETVILDIRSTYYEDGSIKTTGTYTEGKKEGTHRVYDKQGNIINSFIYKQGNIIGEGIVDESGLYQGEWKFYFDSGEVKLEGEFIDSKKQGTWTYYYPNGKKKQVGKFKKGKASGTW